MNSANPGDRYESLSRLMDHAVLRPTSTLEQLEAGCQLAVRYRVASICLLPYCVPRAAQWLQALEDGTHGVALSTVIGFPHGTQPTSVKIADVDAAAAGGAVELDMVANVSLVKGHMWEDVADDIGAVVQAARGRNCMVKVIFETSELTLDEIARLCEICNELRPDYIKTSTGFASGGATPESVTQMRQMVDATIGVKASGGIRDLETALRYRQLGAGRLGTSSTAAILDAWKEKCEV